jgi:predicted ferric reductase
MTYTAATVVTSTTPLWYATRATGVIALILMTGSVVLGITASVRYASDRWPRLVTLGVHRNLSLLVTVFLVLHIVTAELDTFAPVGWLAVAVPFVSAYRPLWLGLGTVAFDLLVAVTVTSLLRARIGHRVWRLVHWTAYACWPLAVVHGLGTGTDTRSSFVLGVTVLCVIAVLVAATWRLAEGWPANSAVRLAAGVLGAVVTLVVIGWTLAGPLKPGWSARAGTPAPPPSSSASPTPTPSQGSER